MYGKIFLNQPAATIPRNNHKKSLCFGSYNNFQQSQVQQQPVYPAFKIPVSLIKEKLINAVDGLKAYAANVPLSWQAFPARNSEHQAPAFSAVLDLNNEASFNKSQKDGGIDYNEKNLAANQMAYDNQANYAQGSAEHNSGWNAINLLNSIFQGKVYQQAEGLMRPEFDVNKNNKLDAEDVNVIAPLDGDPANLSSQDLEMASNIYLHYSK